jgi:hypothetical protein
MYTIDIRKEYNWIKKALIYNTSEKYQKLRNHKIKFLFICDFDSENEGLLKEMAFAMKTEAKYWNPAPGIQSKIYHKNRRTQNEKKNGN